jgi:hypothetical protein
MFYVLGIFMFLAACIIAIGWAGRGAETNPQTEKTPEPRLDA